MERDFLRFHGGKPSPRGGVRMLGRNLIGQAPLADFGHIFAYVFEMFVHAAFLLFLMARRALFTSATAAEISLPMAARGASSVVDRNAMPASLALYSRN
jgi:hypothetical protein